MGVIGLDLSTMKKGAGSDQNIGGWHGSACPSAPGTNFAGQSPDLPVGRQTGQHFCQPLHIPLICRAGHTHANFHDDHVAQDGIAAQQDALDACLDCGVSFQSQEMNQD